MERWLAAEPGGALATTEDAFTDLERFALEAILSFAREPDNDRQELMFCLTPDGSKLVGVTTGVKAAPITDRMRAAMNATGARFWHNHPSQDSLSHYDWLCAAVDDRVELVAVNASGSIFAGRVTAWRDEILSALNEAPSIAADVEFAMSDACRVCGNMNLAVSLATFTGHVVNLALAELGACTYSYLLSIQDQAVIDDAITAGVLQVGLARANAEFAPLLSLGGGNPVQTGRPTAA